MKKILILANDVTTILQFRTELVKALAESGNEVIVCVPESDRIPEIESLGASVIKTEVARHGKNPFQDLKLLNTYKKIIKTVKPDVVFTFTIKPNVYGGMAAASLNVPYVANVTGLGVVGDKGILQKLMLWLYKTGLKKAKCVFFQNSANKQFFEDNKIVKGKTELLPGSGVNLEKFSAIPYPENGVINLTFVGRVIKDKGVYELAEAAKHYLNDEGVTFTVVGDVEFGAENPFTSLKNVNCVGFHKDVRPFVKNAHAVILPSYHEGMANVLLEGAASARPILASNIPGCKESFDEGVTGFGFEIKNSASVIEAIDKFLALSYEDKKLMGERARIKMEKEFSRQIIIDKYFEMIN